MCTLSWEYCGGDYIVFFNRDELKTRVPALPVRENTSKRGVRILHPVDGEKGGSWIAVNQWGVTTCLLNLYEYPIQSIPREGFQSRGHLVMEMADSRSLDETQKRLSDIDPCVYPPFHFVQFDPKNGIKSMKWTGQETHWLNQPDRCLTPLSGSSYKNTEVVRQRIETYQRLVFSGDKTVRLNQLEQYHHWQHPESGAFSVKMMRPDAQTMSFSRIEVSPNQIQFSYAPCFMNSECFEIPTLLLMRPELGFAV